MIAPFVGPDLSVPRTSLLPLPLGGKKPGILDSRTIVFYYSISSGLLRRSFLCLRQAQFVALNIGREVFVVAPLERLVHVAAAKQEHLDRQINLRKARHPESLLQPHLLHHQGGARTERKH